MTRPGSRQAMPIVGLILSALAWTGAGDASPERAPENERALDAGFTTLENMCFSCHSPDAATENRIAPPMAAIRRHYMNETSSLEDFRRALLDFVNDPSRDNARMPGAIKRFGLMPKLSFDDAALADVAYYLYHTPMDAPAWFENHYAAAKTRYASAVASQRLTMEDYLDHGQQLAMQTKTVLGSNLKNALKDGGPEAAVSFCNIRARPIATEMSEKLDAGISRVSDRPRNPDNRANEDELTVIKQVQAALARGDKPTPAVRELEDRVIGYYPIVTNGMCLQCHGAVGTDITPATHAVIQEAYPADQAIGYGSNELRGLFVVEMEKSNRQEK